jgi:hypothetical protein
MYFLIETEEQLSKLQPRDSCFLQIIPNNYAYHPKLANVSLYYYRSDDKGYVFSVEHSESFTLDNKLVVDFINKHKTLYVVDKKYHLHFLNHSGMVDLQFLKPGVKDQKTQIQLEYERLYRGFSGVNNVIPIVKHYEHMNALYDAYKDCFGKTYSPSIDRVIEAYNYVEQNPIGVDEAKFFSEFKLSENQASFERASLYNQYNLHNQTGRPTNSFNGVNFLAIPKDAEHRDCFVPKNDYFVEFDFDGYHLRLVSNEVGYSFGKQSVHETLGKIYFDKDQLTEEEYKESKTISFKNLYGGVPEAHQRIEFFRAMVTLSNKLSEGCAPGASMELPTGITLHRDEDMYDSKLLNYYVQNLETKRNAEKILQLKEILRGMKTKLVLITYDAFLFDYSLSDGKELLLKVKDVLEQDNMATKHKHGKTYFL